MNSRRLTLKREVRQELSAADLAAVAGAAEPITTIVEVAETMYSCLHYISCAFLHTCYVPTIEIGTVVTR